VAWRCFDVAVRYFEEIPKKNKQKKNRKKPIECSDVLVECE